MNAGELDWLAYDWGGGRERIVRIGSDGAATRILFLPPLFEESNRTRHFLIEIMRGLTSRGFCCFLPDLPGTLESVTPLDTVAWDDWQGAIAEIAKVIERPFHVASVRGGALLDHFVSAQSCWRLAPARGDGMLRELVRTRMAADREDGRDTTTAALEAQAKKQGLDVAGYQLGPALLSGLGAATPAPDGRIRTVRLDTDPLPADARFSAPPLWRQSGPSSNSVFVQYVTSDIADWVSACGNG